jgi:hypothetical protein
MRSVCATATRRLASADQDDGSFRPKRLFRQHEIRDPWHRYGEYGLRAAKRCQGAGHRYRAAAGVCVGSLGARRSAAQAVRSQLFRGRLLPSRDGVVATVAGEMRPRTNTAATSLAVHGFRDADRIVGCARIQSFASYLRIASRFLEYFYGRARTVETATGRCRGLARSPRYVPHRQDPIEGKQKIVESGIGQQRWYKAHVPLSKIVGDDGESWSQ